MKKLFLVLSVVTLFVSSAYGSEATVASVGERILNEILARTRDGVGHAIERTQQTISNVIQDKTILNDFYKAIINGPQFSKFVSVDEDGSYLIDWNNLAADPDAFSEFVKIVKESSIYVKLTESFQQTVSNTLSNAQLLNNLSRLNDILNKVQNSFRQAISPTLDKIKVKF